MRGHQTGGAEKDTVLYSTVEEIKNSILTTASNNKHQWHMINRKFESYDIGNRSNKRMNERIDQSIIKRRYQ